MERQDCTTSHYVYLDVHNERIIYNQDAGQYCLLNQLYRDILTNDGKFVRIKLNRSWIEKIFDRLKGRKGNVESVVYSTDGQDRYNLTEKLDKESILLSKLELPTRSLSLPPLIVAIISFTWLNIEGIS